MDMRQPIGIFDSGVGGLTVYKELRALLPEANLLYFGDTARAPYGSRPAWEIRQFTDEMLQLLVEYDCQAGVIACNTITVLGPERLGEGYAFPLIGNSDGTAAAVAATRNGKIGVLATEATIRSGKHQAALLARNAGLQVWEVAARHLAALVEQGQWDCEAMQTAIAAYCQPLRAAGVDTVILGCTHYPLLTAQLQAELGPAVRLINPAVATAKAVQERLSITSSGGQPGWSRLFVSARADRANAVLQRLLPAATDRFQVLALRGAAPAGNMKRTSLSISRPVVGKG